MLSRTSKHIISGVLGASAIAAIVRPAFAEDAAQFSSLFRTSQNPADARPFTSASTLPDQLVAHGFKKNPEPLSTYDRIKQFIAYTLLGKTNQDLTKENNVVDSILGAVGNTPLIELKSLSALTGCRILAKAEYMNPALSVKDRAARQMILEAEQAGILKPGGTIVEATGGNTGVGLAMAAAARGYKAIFTMPNYVTKEKQDAMKIYGAEVHLIQPCPFANPNHFYHQAARLAESMPGAVFLNQFENEANFRAHYTGTAPEIWQQTQHKVDAFVCSMGTGGTMSGCSTYLKEKNPNLKTFVIDPPGSGLLNYFTTGEMKMEPGNTILQGVGLARKTRLVELAQVDGGFRSNDKEAVEMCYYLLRNEGIFVGPTAAVNVCGAVKVARQLVKAGKKDQVVVAILCDAGQQYASTVFDKEWLKMKGLTPQATGKSIDFVADN